jgi:alanine racemase
LFPVLKSNAYGHGIKQIIQILSKLEVPYVVVDSYPEYKIVHRYSDKQILIIGETLPDNYRKFNFSRTAFAVYNIQTLQALGRIRKPVRIHLFLNTGMNREGVDNDDLSIFLETCKQYPNIQIEWVMSHLYGADGIELIDELDQELGGQKTTVEKQILLFKEMYYHILEYGYSPLWRHIGNSAWMFKIKEKFFNARRPGLAMYGYSPLQTEDPVFPLTKKLLPALSISSRVISLHKVWPWDGVSYGHTYVFEGRELVGSAPFGYAEWLARNASGKISFTINKKRYPQLGTICMNLCSFLADDLVAIGDEIQIISCNPKDKNTLSALAEASQTIPYECLIRFDKGMRRQII